MTLENAIKKIVSEYSELLIRQKEHVRSEGFPKIEAIWCGISDTSGPWQTDEEWIGVRLDGSISWAYASGCSCWDGEYDEERFESLKEVVLNHEQHLPEDWERSIIRFTETNEIQHLTDMPFTEQLRYQYPLEAGNLVIDVGGYKGEFASRIHQIYAVDVDVYEPIPDFYHECTHNLNLYPVVRVLPQGVGGRARKEILKLETDRTGVFATGKEVEVDILDIKDVVRDRKVDLLKINIEGMEYELLERLIETGQVKQIKNIQVQFHKIGDNYQERYEKIYAELLKTHELSFNFPFVWQSFVLKV